MPDIGLPPRPPARPPRRRGAAGSRPCCAASCCSTCAAAGPAGRGPALPRPVPERAAGGPGRGACATQARIYAGAHRREPRPGWQSRTAPKLVPEAARPLLRRLADPTPGAQARLYRQYRPGTVAAHLPGARGRRPAPVVHRAAAAAGSRAAPFVPATGSGLYDRGDRRCCRAAAGRIPLVDVNPDAPSGGWRARTSAAGRDGRSCGSAARARAARCHPTSAAPG